MPGQMMGKKYTAGTDFTADEIKGIEQFPDISRPLVYVNILHKFLGQRIEFLYGPASTALFYLKQHR